MESIICKKVPQPDSLCSHLLRLHFPATELLAPGKLPYTKIPVEVEYREEPTLGAYHLDSSNLEYFTRFNTSQAEAPPETAEDTTDISRCISRLANAPGVSDLSAVSYIGEDDIWTKFCLKTTWITARGNVLQKSKVFHVCSTEWHLRLGYAESDPCGSWLTLMDDLMQGRTDRAVLHRRRKLHAFNPNYSEESERLWPLNWDELQLQRPNQLLANHLEHIYMDPEEGEGYAPMLVLRAYGDDDVIKARLPCDHFTTFYTGTLQNMSEEHCVLARCDIKSCQQRIMTASDDRQLDLASDRELRAMWSIEQIDWERFDQPILEQCAVAQLPAGELLKSLQLALGSMHVPRSTTPAGLNATKHAETEIITRHLGNILRSSSSETTMTPAAMFLELGEQATAALKASNGFQDEQALALTMPPGYNDFLSKWFTRAVNHAFGISTSVCKADVSDVMKQMEKVDLAGERRDSQESIEMC